MVRALVLSALAAVAICSTHIQARDAADLAWELTQKEMKPAEWKKFVASTKSKYETWASDNADGSLKRYLDDKLVEIAPAVLKGNVPAVKKLIFWVALYKEFGEPAHSAIEELAMTHQEDLDNLMKDFSWEKAAETIKNRKKKMDESRAAAQMAMKK